MKRTICLAFALAIALIVTSCGGDSDDGGGEVAGIIAIGHSGLTGHNADPERPDEEAKELSWATGTEPDIHSIYQRLVEVRPETADKVSNMAVGGAVSASLASQAERALEEVPEPAIAIILTIDNDIRCDGKDADHVAAFGENVRKALDLIAEESPDSKILVVSFFGRPSPEDVIAITAERPDLKGQVTGSGECDWYDPSGEINPESFATFNAIVDGYEAEQARVCAEVPQCSTDGGAATLWEDDPVADYTDDFTHLNQQGLARFAEHMWPVVEALLNEAQ